MEKLVSHVSTCARTEIQLQQGKSRKVTLGRTANFGCAATGSKLFSLFCMHVSLKGILYIAERLFFGIFLAKTSESI